MARLRQDYSEFVKRDTEIIVAGPEDSAAFEAYWTKESLPFIGLPDPHHKILKLYGQEINLFKLGRLPAQVITDKNSMARFVHYGHSMMDIPSTPDMIRILDTLNPKKSFP